MLFSSFTLALFGMATSKSAIAIISPDQTAKLNVTGTIRFEHAKESELIQITYKIIGLPPNTEHGWHVHNLPLANLRNCSSAGLHFNPKNVTHGAPTDEIRHYGDLGNMKSNADGVAEFTVTDRLLSLFGELNTLNRAIVVHALQDDLGKDGNATSLSVGNSGARLGCGNIELIPDVTTTSVAVTTTVKASPTSDYSATTTGSVKVTTSIVNNDSYTTSLSSPDSTNPPATIAPITVTESLKPSISSTVEYKDSITSEPKDSPAYDSSKDSSTYEKPKDSSTYDKIPDKSNDNYQVVSSAIGCKTLLIFVPFLIFL